MFIDLAIKCYPGFDAEEKKEINNLKKVYEHLAESNPEERIRALKQVG